MCVFVLGGGYLNYEVDQLVLEHLLRVEVCNKETDVIALHKGTHKKTGNDHHFYKLYEKATRFLTSTGLRRRMKKCSALIIMKRINFLHKIFSISSA